MLDSLALYNSLLLHGGLKPSFLLDRSSFGFPSDLATRYLSRKVLPLCGLLGALLVLLTLEHRLQLLAVVFKEPVLVVET